MERIEFDTDYFDSPSPAGSNRTGYATYKETESYLVEHIRGYLMKRNPGQYLTGYPTLTVHSCWSGYSEYTITSTWSEIQIDWNGLSAFFKTTPEFFLALAEVNPDNY